MCATLAKGYTFGATEEVTNAKLHSLVDSGTISAIVNADVAAGANIGEAKLSLDGTLIAALTGTQTIGGDKTFTGNSTFAGTTIADLGTVTTADINAGTVDATIGGTTPAAITGTVVEAGTSLAITGTGDDGVVATGIKDEDAMGSDSATHLATQQSIKKYVDDSGVTDATSGTYKFFDNGHVQHSTSTSYVKVFEMMVGRSGTITVKHGHAGNTSAGGFTHYSRIYRDGIAVGTQQSNVDTKNWTEFTEAISGWTEGDLLQLYIKTSSSPTGEATTGGAVSLWEAIPSLKGAVTTTYTNPRIYKNSFAPGGSGSYAYDNIGDIGDLWVDTGGGASTTLYVKTGATTWTAK